MPSIEVSSLCWSSLQVHLPSILLNFDTALSLPTRVAFYRASQESCLEPTNATCEAVRQVHHRLFAPHANAPEDMCRILQLGYCSEGMHSVSRVGLDNSVCYSIRHIPRPSHTDLTFVIAWL